MKKYCDSYYQAKVVIFVKIACNYSMHAKTLIKIDLNVNTQIWCSDFENFAFGKWRPS